VPTGAGVLRQHGAGRHASEAARGHWWSSAGQHTNRALTVYLYVRVCACVPIITQQLFIT
jgi:hypothetical protein